MRLILPVLLILLGLAGGLAAGHFLKPAAEAPHAAGAADPAARCDPARDADCAEAAAADYAAPPPAKVEDPDKKYDYVKLNKQFVVPVLTEEKVSSLIVLSIEIEVEAGYSEEVFSREPKLRDALLQVLFEHAHSGGFNGVFTSEHVMADLRGRMQETVAALIGPVAHDVLITDIVRRDL